MATPQQIADKWKRNLTNARQDYINGVNAVTTSPMQSAIAAAPRWKAAMRNVIDNDLWEAGLRRAGTLQEWQRRCTEVGATRLAAGAQAGEQAVLDFMTRWMPILERNVATVRALPNTTFQERITRMTRMAELNHQAAGQARGGNQGGRVGVNP